MQPGFALTFYVDLWDSGADSSVTEEVGHWSAVMVQKRYTYERPNKYQYVFP